MGLDERDVFKDFMIYRVEEIFWDVFKENEFFCLLEKEKNSEIIVLYWYCISIV